MEVEEETKVMEYEAYWGKVAELKDGDWQRFAMLPSFANALGTVFNSNSEAERAFSVQSDIHRSRTPWTATCRSSTAWRARRIWRPVKGARKRPRPGVTVTVVLPLYQRK